jgi:hypothetical protein
MIVVDIELQDMSEMAPKRERRWCRQEKTSGMYMVERGCEIRSGANFQHIAVRTTSERFHDVLVFTVHRQKHNLGARFQALQFTKRLKAVELGHRDIQDNQVGLEALRRTQRLPSISRGGDHIEIVREFSAHGIQELRVVIG